MPWRRTRAMIMPMNAVTNANQIKMLKQKMAPPSSLMPANVAPPFHMACSMTARP